MVLQQQHIIYVNIHKKDKIIFNKNVKIIVV